MLPLLMTLVLLPYRATAQGDLDLQFPDGPLGGSEPIEDAGPVTIRLEHLEVYADLGPGPGGRAPLDRLLLTIRLLGELDRLLSLTSAPAGLAMAALSPGAMAPEDWPVLPLPPHTQPMIPSRMLPEWIEVVAEAANVELAEPDNPAGTYWPSKLYTLKISETLDPTDTRQVIQRLRNACTPPSGWQPDPSVSWSELPMLVRGEGADPTYVERATSDGRRFRVGVGLFLEEGHAQRLASTLSSCLGRSLTPRAMTHDGRAISLVHGPSANIP